MSVIWIGWEDDKEAQIKNVALPWAPTALLCSQTSTVNSPAKSCLENRHRVCFGTHQGYSVLTHGVPAVDTTHRLAFFRSQVLEKALDNIFLYTLKNFFF